MNTARTFDDINSFPLSLLVDLVSKYSITPGTTHYFPKRHPSGLGGMYVYFPRSLDRLQGLLFPSAPAGGHNTQPEPDLPERKTAEHPPLLIPEGAYRRYSQKLWQWLQHAKKLSHLSSGILLASATMFSNLC